MKKVLVLGCTGSIGSNALDVIRSMPDQFRVCALAANRSKERLAALAEEFGCPAALAEEGGGGAISNLIRDCGADIAVNGIAGAAGLLPSIWTAERGIDLALANKESVVMAWPILKRTADANGAKIIPVDSEHSAVFSLIQKCGAENVESVIITASGGPFRTFSREQLEKVTVKDALRHPTWSMGAKITIDSASLANKGLEVIEAARLFSIAPERIQVAVHPQSLVHSLVRTKDGVLYAQISDPDMRRPILGALSWPKIEGGSLEPYDITAGLEEGGQRILSFEKPRTKDFPMLEYAYRAAKSGGSYAIAYNAANEAAVAAFAEGKISFMQIPEAVASVLGADWSREPDDIGSVLESDAEARRMAQDALARLGGGA